MFVNIVFDSVHLFFARYLIGVEDRRLHLVFAIRVYGFDDVSRRFLFDEFLFRYADLGQERFLPFNDFLDFIMSEHDGIEDVSFRNLFGTAFYHEDGVLCAGNANVHVAGFGLFYCRVANEFAVNAADADTGDRAGKGNVGHAQGNGSADHGSDFRSIVVVYAEIISDDVYVVAVCFREERTDRAVDEAGKECSRFRRFAFPFDKAAGDLPYGVHFFFIIDSQGEEICIFPGFLRARCRDEYGCIAVTYQGGTTSLFGELSYFDDEGTAGKIHLEYLFFHIFKSSLQCSCNLYAGCRS